MGGPGRPGWPSLAAVLGVFGATAAAVRQASCASILGCWSHRCTTARVAFIRCGARDACAIRIVQRALACLAILLLVVASWRLLELTIGSAQLVALWAAALWYVGLIAWAAWLPEARRAPRRRKALPAPPNILLIGSDTLRADRLGALGYRRALTPNIDALARKGALFANCYVPARAPRRVWSRC